MRITKHSETYYQISYVKGFLIIETLLRGAVLNSNTLLVQLKSQFVISCNMVSRVRSAFRNETV